MADKHGFTRIVADSRYSSYSISVHGPNSTRVSMSAGNDPCRLHDTFAPDQAEALGDALRDAAAECRRRMAEDG